MARRRRAGSWRAVRALRSVRAERLGMAEWMKAVVVVVVVAWEVGGGGWRRVRWPFCRIWRQ